jgi:nucleoside-diphosphate-sugar epimerase
MRGSSGERNLEDDKMKTSISVVMMGASGAVGQETLTHLLTMPQIQRITLLGRRPLKNIRDERVVQHIVDVCDPTSYRDLLAGHAVAICTLGVGQPSLMSKAEFIRIDKDAVLQFANACRDAKINHFQLLGSVGANAHSAAFYLRCKGQLRDAIAALQFSRFSAFQPSMILTPTNRYGLQQALTLAVWPLLSPVLRGAWRQYRGIRVATLGTAIARNVLLNSAPVEILQWDQFIQLARPA